MKIIKIDKNYYPISGDVLAKVGSKSEFYFQMYVENTKGEKFAVLEEKTKSCDFVRDLLVTIEELKDFIPLRNEDMFDTYKYEY